MSCLQIVHLKLAACVEQNELRIALYKPQPNKLIILAAQDNLVKGASGQAVQNMNLMFGFNEDEGLQGIGLLP